MPRGDGTGPDGKGPGTGRGLGNCLEKNVPVPDYDSKIGEGPGRNRGRYRD